ncbi:MAG: hypothetical protein M3357_04100 [Actinomycetota bacterium]|nr:hypothetical protein [Actinomycetota bacterium]
MRTKILAGATAVLLVGAGFVAWQVTHRGAPSFRRGGEFAGGAPGPISTTTTVSTAPAAVETTTSSMPPTTATTVPASGTTPRRTTTTRAATATTTRPQVTSTAPATTPSTAASPAPTTAPAGPQLPALGNYVYAVDGQESASIMGARRLPNRMTTVVHGASGLAADQVVFDLRYSNEHEEREIVGYRGDGVYFDYEAGSISFGPRTESSEADYEPPMLQIPSPLQAGVTRSGTSKAKGSGGSVVRDETWKVTVVGQENVTVAGAAVAAWKVQVDRTFQGGSESGTKNRTYWYDPARLMWVKFTEVFHGERRQSGFSFTYDMNATATLESFTPA